MSFQPEEQGPPTLTGGLLESETEPCELSAELIFRCPSFQHTGLLVTAPALGFLHIHLPQSGAPAVLGLLLWDPAKTVSARLNPRNSTTDVRGVCNFLNSVSSR